MTTQAISNGLAWSEIITDQIERLQAAIDAGDEAITDEVRQEISESLLCLSVRSLWVPLGSAMEPAEFCILLSTGGPALRIVGELDDGNIPQNAVMEWQDWGTPWRALPGVASEVLTQWAGQFYWGD